VKVLLLRAGALGDVLLLRPTIFALRAAGEEVTLLAPSEAACALLGAGPGEAHAVLPWERAGHAALHAEEARLPWLTGFDLAVAYTRSAAVLENLRRHISKVVGWDPTPAGGAHAAEWLARPVRTLGFAAPADPPPLAFSPEEREAARRVVARLPPRFLALHPGSGSAAKNWPAPLYEQLAAHLEPHRRWLLVEGPADGEEVAALHAARGAERVAGLGARELGAVLAECGLYVGNDSGVSHLAAAAGAPTLALFGPTDPAVWSPVGPRVRALRARQGALALLEVDTVGAAARTLRRGEA
jgi:ADP-heptose:LPS heptosyltransferase